MKARLKWFVCLSLIFAFLFCGNAFLCNGLELGISLSISSEQAMYEAGDEVKLSTVITNNTARDYSDLSLVYYLPAQLKPDASFSQTVQIPSLKAGQSFRESTVAGILDPDAAGSSLWILWVILAVIAVGTVLFFILRKKKGAVRALSLCLLFALLLSLIPLRAQAAFISPSSTYVSAETVMRKLGVIPDTVASADAIRKRDLAQSLYILLTGKTDASAYADAHYFKDVPKNHPYAGYINFVAPLGIMEWDTDENNGKTFSPSERISNQEIARTLMRLLCGGNGRGEFTDSAVDALVLSSGLSTGFVKLNGLATPASLGTLLVNLLTITPSAAVKDGAFYKVASSSLAFAAYCPAFVCEDSIITTATEASQTGVHVISALKIGTPVYLLSKNGFSFAAPRPALLAVTAGKLQYEEDALPLYAALYESAAPLPYYGDKPVVLKPTEEEKEEEKPVPPPQEEEDPDTVSPFPEYLSAAIVTASDDLLVELASGGTYLSLLYPSDYNGYRPLPGEVVVIRYTDNTVISVEKPEDLVGFVSAGKNNTVKIDMSDRSFGLLNLVSSPLNENNLRSANTLPKAIEDNQGKIYAAIFIYNGKVAAWLPAETENLDMLVTSVTKNPESGEMTYLHGGVLCTLPDVSFRMEENETAAFAVLSMQNGTVTVAERLFAVTAEVSLSPEGVITAGEIIIPPENIATGISVENGAGLSSAESLSALLSNSSVTATLFYLDHEGEHTLFAYTL